MYEILVDFQAQPFSWVNCLQCLSADIKSLSKQLTRDINFHGKCSEDDDENNIKQKDAAAIMLFLEDVDLTGALKKHVNFCHSLILKISRSEEFHFNDSLYGFNEMRFNSHEFKLNPNNTRFNACKVWTKHWKTQITHKI